MARYELPNSTTPDGMLVEVATKVPAFGVMTLVFVWVLIFFGGMNRQNRRFGYSDAPQWAVLASAATVLLSLVMTIKEGIIGTDVLVYVISVAVLSAVWFFLTRGRFE